MTGRERKAINTIAGTCGGIFAAIALFSLIGLAQHKDWKDDQALRAELAKRQSEAAQQSTWAKLDRQGCAMVACDRMPK